MTGFLASIIEDSRPRQQASAPPGGIDGLSGNWPRSGNLHNAAPLAESLQSGSASGDATSLGTLTAPGLASLAPLAKSSHATRQPGPAEALGGDSKAASQDQTSDPFSEDHVLLHPPVDLPSAGIREKIQANRLNPTDAMSDGDLKARSRAKSYTATAQARVQPSLGFARDASDSTENPSRYAGDGTPSGPGIRGAAFAVSSHHSTSPERRIKEGGESFAPPSPREASSVNGDHPQSLSPTALPDRPPRVYAHGQPGMSPRDHRPPRAAPKPDVRGIGANPSSSEPKVHVGRVDVTLIAAPTPGIRAPRSAASQRINRQYLRRV